MTAPPEQYFDSLNRRIGKDSLITSLVGLVTRVAPLLATMAIAMFYGTGWLLDAYYLTMAIPVLLAGLIGMAVNTVFVPILVEEEKKDSLAFEGFLNSLFTCVSLISLVITALYALLTPLICSILAGALSEEARILVRDVSLELSPVIFLITVRSFLSAVSHARRSFLSPTYALTLVPAATIVSLFLFHDRLGIHSLVIGNNAGFLLAAVFLYLSLRLNGIRIGIGWQFDRRIFDTLRLSLPQVLSASVLKLNPLIDRTVASYLAVGCISALAYAERIQSVPLQILNLGFYNVVLAHWSYARAEDGLAKVKKSLLDLQQMLLSLALPLFLYLWIFRRELIGLFLEHGALDAAGADMISSVYGVYLIGMIPLFLSMVYVRAFLVLKDTVFLMKVGFFNVASKLILNLVFVFVLDLGVEGIALSTTVTSWVILFIMFAALRTRLGELPLRVKAKEMAQLVLVVAGVSVVTGMLWDRGQAFYGRWLLVAMCSAFFFLCYFLSMYMLKDDAYLKLRNLVWRR